MSEFPLDTESNRSKNGGRMRKWYVWLFIALLCALLLSNMAGETIRNLFTALLAGLTPIIIALFLSFLLIKPINLIENKLLKSCFVGNKRAPKYKRAISLTIVFSLLILIVVLLFVFGIPSIVGTIQQFTDAEYQSELINKLNASLTQIAESLFGMSSDDASVAIANIIDSVVNGIKEFMGSFANNFSNYVSIIISTVSAIGMGMILTFLMLKDKELIAKTSKRFIYAYNSPKKAEEIVTMARHSHKMLNEYVISTLIIMAIIFGIAWIGYAIIGVPYAFLMALMLGVFSIIPYIGGIVAIIPLAIVTLMLGDPNIMLASVIFGVLDWALVATFMPSFIMSKRTNTRAVILILTMVIMSAMFGVIGLILSGPVAAVISVYMRERLEVREAYQEHEELMRAGVGNDNLCDVSEMLDLTEDNLPMLNEEKEEKDYKLLTASKAGRKKRKNKDDVVVKTKTKARKAKEKSSAPKSEAEITKEIKEEERKESDSVL